MPPIVNTSEVAKVNWDLARLYIITYKNLAEQACNETRWTSYDKEKITLCINMHVTNVKADYPHRC